jgi:hypothetical protein
MPTPATYTTPVQWAVNMTAARDAILKIIYMVQLTTKLPSRNLVTHLNKAAILLKNPTQLNHHLKNSVSATKDIPFNNSTGLSKDRLDQALVIDLAINAKLA